MKFHNLAREYSTTTGTSDALLTGAVPGCNTFEDAGVVDGEVVRYGIITYNTSTHQPTGSEVGIGTYTFASSTLSRTTVESSTSAGSKITLTGLSEVYICPTSLDYNTGANPQAVLKHSTTQAINDGQTVTVIINTVTTDPEDIISLASNTITFLVAGWYEFSARIYVAAGAAFDDGHITLLTNNSGTSDDMQISFPTQTSVGITQNMLLIRQRILQTVSSTLAIGLQNECGQNLTVQAQEVVLDLVSRS
jgi:hypothetical protein